jgi:hypothetical protein
MYFAKFLKPLKHDIFVTFENIETGHVLNFSKLQNTELAAICRYVIGLKTYVFDLKLTFLAF